MEIKKSYVKQSCCYNANYKSVVVHPFQDTENEKHSGCVVSADEQMDNFHLIRLQFNTKDDLAVLMRPFEIFGRKFNISSYFSSYQYKSGILDIPLKGCMKDLNFKMPLDSRDFITITVFGDDKNDVGNPFEMDESYVAVKNTSQDVIKVNLFDLCKGNNTNDSLVVTNNRFCESIKKYGLIRVFSNNNTQLLSNLKLTNPSSGEEVFLISPAEFYHTHQFQSNVVDIPISSAKSIHDNITFEELQSMPREEDKIPIYKPHKYTPIEINNESEILVYILPSSTVMYYFC